MGTCLITTLKETVQDNSLLKLGEFKIHITAPSPILLGAEPLPGKTCVVTLLPPGYFTNEQGTANLGNTYTYNDASHGALVASGSYDALIDNKYASEGFSVGLTGNVGLDIDDLDGCKNIKNIMIATDSDVNYDEITADKFPVLVNLTIDGNNAKGSIESLPHSIVNLRTGASKKITGNISCLASNSGMNYILMNGTGIDGNVSVFANHPGMTAIHLGDTNITGNLSSFSVLTNLQQLSLHSTQVTGNISSLSSLTNLRSLEVSFTAITGDTSSLANLTNLVLFNHINTAITGAWPLT